MTQSARVLALLRQRGSHGLTAADFLRFPTQDGGPPITRLAARILELRDDGHRIESAGRRDRLEVYVLREARLFEPPVSPVNAVLADFDEAA